MRRTLFPLVAALLLAMASCSSEDSPAPGPGPDPEPDPDPAFDIDIVVFRVYSLESAGREQLRWLGTPDGPLPESPEQTTEPWIGFARGFRIEWRAYSEDDPIEGTRYKVSEEEFGPWLPQDPDGNPVWGDVDAFTYENLRTASELFNEDCPEGPDCIGQLRLESGRHRIAVLARTVAGRELDAELGILDFEINYPPTVEFVEDLTAGPADPASAPVAWWARQDGSTVRVALSRGDTIPSGAWVRFRLRGRDRIRSQTDTDSFCCDELLSSSGTDVTYQGFTSFVREDPEGIRDSLFSVYGPDSIDSMLVMQVGPFDYDSGFRALDEHGRRGDAVNFAFVSGFPPPAPTVSVPDGGHTLLHPERDPGPGEFAFVRSGPLTLKWDDLADEWNTFVDGPAYTGYWYEIPLRFRGASDPRVDDLPTGNLPGQSPSSDGFTDHVRSFEYVLLNPADPENAVQEGVGDLALRFVDADRIGELDLEGERTWRVFIPDVFFAAPSIFDPDTGQDEITRGIGAFTRARLGDFHMRLRSRTAALESQFHQLSPQAARNLVVSLRNHGRFSPPVELDFEVRLAILDGDGQLIGTWPPAAP